MMRIACTLAPGKGDTDLLLFRVAQLLLARGHRPCGVVQINSERCDGGACDMDVQVLPDGPVIRISQDLGTASKGCRLDPGALEQAVGEVAARLRADADLLIVNKFGKHEADGRGFRDVIAEACARNIPVLVGLNQLNRQAFFEFCGGAAVELPCSEQALLGWVTEGLLDAA